MTLDLSWAEYLENYDTIQVGGDTYQAYLWNNEKWHIYRTNGIGGTYQGEVLHSEEINTAEKAVKFILAQQVTNWAQKLNKEEEIHKDGLTLQVILYDCDSIAYWLVYHHDTPTGEPLQGVVPWSEEIDTAEKAVDQIKNFH